MSVLFLVSSVFGIWYTYYLFVYRKVPFLNTILSYLGENVINSGKNSILIKVCN